MEANIVATPNTDKCRKCKSSSLCLPQGREAFAGSFKPTILAHGNMDAEVLKSIENRVHGIVCQLGLGLWPMGKPVDWDAVQTASNLRELTAFIRGFAMGVSETVCDLTRDAVAVSLEQFASSKEKKS